MRAVRIVSFCNMIHVNIDSTSPNGQTIQPTVGSELPKWDHACEKLGPSGNPSSASKDQFSDCPNTKQADYLKIHQR